MEKYSFGKVDKKALATNFAKALKDEEFVKVVNELKISDEVKSRYTSNLGKSMGLKLGKVGQNIITPGPGSYDHMKMNLKGKYPSSILSNSGNTFAIFFLLF